MKKERQKHIPSNTGYEQEADLRKLSRTTFRNNPIDMIMPTADGGQVLIKDLEIAAGFAQLVEKFKEARAKKKAELSEEDRKAALKEVAEVWAPDAEAPKKTRKPRKKASQSSFVADEAPAPKKTRKKNTKKASE